LRLGGADVLAVVLGALVDRADGPGDHREFLAELLLARNEGGQVPLHELPVFALGGGGLVVAAREAVLDVSDECHEDGHARGHDAADGDDRDGDTVGRGWWFEDEPQE
jgi:hypothetical protein